MGCLLFPFELFVDTVFEGVLEGWLYLMQWIIPERYFSPTLRIVCKVIVWVFSVLLLLIMLLGLFAVISDDADTKQMGKYMIFIPLGISAIQILLGIIVRIISKKNK